LRTAGVGAILANGGRALRGQMRQASALGVESVLILGDDEVRDGTVAVRDMTTSSQQVVPLDSLVADASGL
jgi:histidyl-tRNA synthetase